MIANLIPYGGPIYWVLLLFGILLTTHFACRERNPLLPAFFATLTGLFVFGFTSYAPSPLEIVFGSVAYLIVGLVYSGYRWGKLVYDIKLFTDNVFQNKNQLAAVAFDAGVDSIKLPPDPMDFRPKILMWILFWPSFTLFNSTNRFFKKLSHTTWQLFFRLSKGIYDR